MPLTVVPFPTMWIGACAVPDLVISRRVEASAPLTQIPSPGAAAARTCRRADASAARFVHRTASGRGLAGPGAGRAFVGVARGSVTARRRASAGSPPARSGAIGTRPSCTVSGRLHVRARQGHGEDRLADDHHRRRDRGRRDPPERPAGARGRVRLYRRACLRAGGRGCIRRTGSSGTRRPLGELWRAMGNLPRGDPAGLRLGTGGPGIPSRSLFDRYRSPKGTDALTA